MEQFSRTDRALSGINYQSDTLTIQASSDKRVRLLLIVLQSRVNATKS